MSAEGRAPRVSICVPTIGRVEFLAATRASISALTFRDFEVLVLDNASPPDSRALIEEWAAGDPRVRVLRVPERIPMFANFNRGIVAAKGEYVTFCHDDDLVTPQFVQRQVDFLDLHPRVGISGSNYAYIDEAGHVTEERTPIRRTEVWSGKRYIRALLRSGRNPLTMQSVFYRRAALDPEGIDLALPINYGDYVLLMRIAERWDVGLVAETLVRVRRHATQFSSGFTLSRGMAMRLDVLRNYLAELSLRMPEEKLLRAELRAAVELSHRTGLLWAWVTAGDASEAEACATSLGRTPVDLALGAALRGLDRVAPPKSPRRAALVGAARRLTSG